MAAILAREMKAKSEKGNYPINAHAINASWNRVLQKDTYPLLHFLSILSA
jgi:hypothetical protein